MNHPAISRLDQHLNGKETIGHNPTRIHRAVMNLDDEWMNPANDPHVTVSGEKVLPLPEQKTRPE